MRWKEHYELWDDKVLKEESREQFEVTIPTFL
jgi:hypothetical protein